MIAALAQDLFTRIQSIPALAASCGLAVGGKDPDPGMTDIPLPAAWVLNTEGVSTLDNNARVVMMTTTSEQRFVVVLYVPYISQSDLITNQLPLLQSVISTVHGNLSPSGERWRYRAHKLTLINKDRLGYRVEFTVDTGML